MRKKIDMKYYEFLEKKGFLETYLNLSFQKILYFAMDLGTSKFIEI